MCVTICECDLQGESPNTPARSSSFRANSKGPATPKRYRTHTQNTQNTYTPHLDQSPGGLMWLCWYSGWGQTGVAPSRPVPPASTPPPRSGRGPPPLALTTGATPRSKVTAHWRGNQPSLRRRRKRSRNPPAKNWMQVKAQCVRRPRTFCIHVITSL